MSPSAFRDGRDFGGGTAAGERLWPARGADGPTPDEAWENGVRLPEANRVHLRAVYEEEYKEETECRGSLPLIGPSPKEKNSIDRAAISRALTRCGFPYVRRRRVTPPVSQRKTAEIS